MGSPASNGIGSVISSLPNCDPEATGPAAGWHPPARRPEPSAPAQQLKHPGTYVLVLRNSRPRRLVVGRLTETLLAPGYYLYVGSAMGSGGLAARLSRHVRGSERRHWHIDYLRSVARVVAVWAGPGARREAAWAACLAADPELQQPIRGFGATDDTSYSHLFWCRTCPQVGLLAGKLPPAEAAGVLVLSAADLSRLTKQRDASSASEGPANQA